MLRYRDPQTMTACGRHLPVAIYEYMNTSRCLAGAGSPPRPMDTFHLACMSEVRSEYRADERAHLTDLEFDRS